LNLALYQFDHAGHLCSPHARGLAGVAPLKHCRGTSGVAGKAHNRHSCFAVKGRFDVCSGYRAVKVRREKAFAMLGIVGTHQTGISGVETARFGARSS
jgi:hypothetical protein